MKNKIFSFLLLALTFCAPASAFAQKDVTTEKVNIKKRASAPDPYTDANFGLLWLDTDNKLHVVAEDGTDVPVSSSGSLEYQDLDILSSAPAAPAANKIRYYFNDELYTLNYIDSTSTIYEVPGFILNSLTDFAIPFRQSDTWQTFTPAAQPVSTYRYLAFHTDGSGNGSLEFHQPSTDDLIEGSQEFFTVDKARTAIDGTSRSLSDLVLTNREIKLGADANPDQVRIVAQSSASGRAQLLDQGGLFADLNLKGIRTNQASGGTTYAMLSDQLYFATGSGVAFTNDSNAVIGTTDLKILRDSAGVAKIVDGSNALAGLKIGSLTLGSSSGFVRASSGVVSVSALVAGDIPDISATYAIKTRAINTGTGLSGGGDLSADRTLSVSNNSTTQKIKLSKAGSLIGTRQEINLIEGSGVTLTTSDNSGSDRVDVTIAASGGISGSGTTGTVPKFSSSSALTDSNITISSSVVTIAGPSGSPGLVVTQATANDPFISLRSNIGQQYFNIKRNSTSSAMLQFVNPGDVTAYFTLYSTYDSDTYGHINGVTGFKLEVNGTEVGRIAGNGLTIGQGTLGTAAKFAIGTANTAINDAVATIYAAASGKGLVIQNNSTSPGNPFEIQSSAGSNSIFNITSAGAVTAAGQITGNTGLAITTAGYIGFVSRGNLLASGDGQWTIRNAANNAIGTINQGKIVTAKTTNYTVLFSDSATVFTNAGASGTVNFTLPTAVANLTYTFLIQAAQTLTITAGASTTIRIAGSVSASAGNITSNTIGNTVTLVAISSTEWLAIAHEGTWTVN